MGNHGTPKTLDDAVINIITFKPLTMTIQDYAHLVLKDFMAQKFGAAYLKAGDNLQTLKILQETFEELTKRG